MVTDTKDPNSGTGREDSASGTMTKSQSWVKKYFWEGQQLNDKEAKKLETGNQTFLQKYRRPIGILIPALFFHFVWWTYMGGRDLFHVFTERSGDGDIPRYYMSITMMFGSMIAGATSEGGAAVAFPVMTLAFSIKPSVARDFSFMIQAVGMTSAAFTIMFMKVKTEMHSMFFCTLGGLAGIIFGLEQVAPQLKPPYAKMYFVVIWFAFAFSLYWLNRNHGRRVFDSIPDFWEKFYGIPWKPLALFAFGVLGGIFSAISGSGIDICSFSVLTLLFRVSEKVATPTSVVLMAINTCIGFLWRQGPMGGVETDAWGFFAVCVPIVVIGAPLGSVLGSHFHRLVLAGLIYVLDTAQLILALVIIKPWGTTKTSTPTHLSLSSLAILIGGIIFFKIMEVSGRKLLTIQEERIAAQDQAAAKEIKQMSVVQMGNM